VLFASLAFNLFLGGAKVWLSRALGDEATPKVEKMREARRVVMKPLREDAKQARKAIH